MNSECAMIILTLVYTVATVILVCSTVRMNKITRKQIDNLNKPLVSLRILYEDTVARLEIANHGNSLARNIKIITKDELLFDDNHTHKKIITDHLKKMEDNIFNLSSNDAIKIFFGQTWDLKLIEPNIIHFHIEYYSITGEKYEDDVEINPTGILEWAENTAQQTPEYQLKKISDSLEGIEKIMRIR